MLYQINGSLFDVHPSRVFTSTALGDSVFAGILLGLWVLPMDCALDSDTSLEIFPVERVA